VLPKKAKIVVIGGGFAGLRVVRQLAKVDQEIILIDRHNYHTFIPLLYQVATGFITPETIAYPFRKYLRSYANTRFLQAEVQKIDFNNKVVTTEAVNLHYDYLVLATGSQSKFLGVDGAAEYALPMKNLAEAIAIRDRLVGNFERASICRDPQLRTRLLTIAIVGGGATGVELAGSIMELIRGTLVRDYPAIALREIKVILIHSGTKLLADYPQNLSDYTCKQLRRKGVKIHFQSRVKKVMPKSIQLDDDTAIATQTVIWTAGVEAEYPQADVDLITGTKNRICVNDSLQLLNYPQAYAIGDLALVKQHDEPLLGIAPEALQQGTAVAKNIQRQLRGTSPKAFKYFNKGKAAIIARNHGVAYLLGKIPLKGFAAWLMWLAIHLYYLPGISNRLLVLGSWLRDYLTGERNLRQLFNYQIATLPKIQASKSDRAVTEDR